MPVMINRTAAAGVGENPRPYATARLAFANAI